MPFDFDHLDAQMSATGHATVPTASLTKGEDRDMIWLYDAKNHEGHPEWKRWAEAHILEQDDEKKRGLKPYKLLRGTARKTVDPFAIKEFDVPGGELLIFDALEKAEALMQPTDALLALATAGLARSHSPA